MCVADELKAVNWGCTKKRRKQGFSANNERSRSELYWCRYRWYVVLFV